MWHTAREQLLFILNEAPLGVFQVTPSKNNRVTLHSIRQPSGVQRDGVGLGWAGLGAVGWGGGQQQQPVSTTPIQQQRSPKHTCSCFSDMHWTNRWEETQRCLRVDRCCQNFQLKGKFDACQSLFLPALCGPRPQFAVTYGQTVSTLLYLSGCLTQEAKSRSQKKFM